MIHKFRAWDKINSEMCTVLAIDYQVEEVLLSDNYDGAWSEFDDIVLMQSTGLKDKKGVEIFEGDITKLDEGDTYHLCVVEFNNDELCYQLTNRKTIGEYIGELVFVRGKHMAECEVVGNIHENRELLEAPNEII